MSDYSQYLTVPPGYTYMSAEPQTSTVWRDLNALDPDHATHLVRVSP